VRPRVSIALLSATLAVLMSVPLAGAAAGIVPPTPTRYVTDPSGALPPDRAAALERKLADFERQTSTQVLVWIAPHVPEGTSAEQLGADAIRAWGVGQKGKDNGAILFVFTEDRALRLATGYGLEGAIPDARAKRILADVVKPHLQRGDLPAGIDAGVDAILRLARGEGFEGTGRTVADRPHGWEWSWFIVPWLIVAALLALVFFRAKPVPAAISFVVGVLGTFLWMTEVLPAPLGAPFTLLAAGAIAVIVVLSKRGAPGWERSYSSSSSSSDWSSSSSSSSGSSSSSDSGFSGGGGDSGGGGASESY
jgi:uncharacterized protein